MAIANMNRFTLLTFHSHKQELLKQLQVFGDVHLRSPDPEQLEQLSFLRPDFSQDELGAYEAELDKVRFAIGRIAPYVEKPKMSAKRPSLTFAQFDRYTSEYDYGAVYEKVKGQDEAIASIRSEIARRTAENDAMAGWVSLDADPADLAAFGKTGSLLGTVNRQVAGEFRSALETAFDTIYIEQLDTVKDDTSLLLLFPSEQGEEVFQLAREQGFTKSALQLRGVPKKVIEENDKRIRELEGEMEQATAQIRSLAPEHGKLQIALDYFDTVLERERARQNFLASDTTLLVEGWVPEDDSARLQSILKAVCGDEYFLEQEAVERDSGAVPIKLKNNKFVKAFESITVMYSMPRYNEIDPTPILAPFYWLFFGMMVGDVGYGLILLLGTTLALKLFDLKEGMRSFMQFFRFLSISVIIFGFVYGGIFGVTFFKPIPDGAGGFKAILDSQKDIVVMLVISIVIGVFHILFGLCTTAYMGFRDGRVGDAICDGLLWVLVLLAGIGWLLFGAGIIEGGSMGTVCMWAFWACVVALAATQGRSSPSIGGKIGNGLYGVYGLTSYVGDIVSYTRIVALALSGAYIAYAFNLMTSLVAGEFTGPASLIRFLFGAIIVVFGQTLNLGLALLGAYVHTCRLQYVEFFGKFYEGGGVMFQPLALKNEYIHIEK